MSSYFSIQIEFDKNGLHHHYIEEFYALLERNGFVWKSGARDSERFSRSEAMKINQEELEGFTKAKKGEPRYYQNLFSFKDYAEVRCWWTNFSESMEFTIIIPEDDFVFWEQYTKEKGLPHNEESMSIIRNLCVDIWENWDCMSIQTAWENTYEYTSGLEEMRKGIRPQILPFAIIPECIFKDRWECKTRRIKNGGLLLEDSEGWEPM